MSATVFPLDRWFRITPAVSGLIGESGNVTNENDSGVVTYQIVTNDPNFVGSFAPMAAIAGGQPNEFAAAFPSGGTVPYLEVPYRALYLNNAPSDGTLRTDLITGNSLIVVAAPGTKIGLLVSCSAGTALVLPNRVQGSMMF